MLAKPYGVIQHALVLDQKNSFWLRKENIPVSKWQIFSDPVENWFVDIN